MLHKHLTHRNSRNSIFTKNTSLSTLLTNRRCYVNSDILRQIAMKQLNDNTSTVINKNILHLTSNESASCTTDFISSSHRKMNSVIKRFSFRKFVLSNTTNNNNTTTPSTESEVQVQRKKSSYALPLINSNIDLITFLKKQQHKHKHNKLSCIESKKVKLINKTLNHIQKKITLHVQQRTCIIKSIPTTNHYECCYYVNNEAITAKITTTTNNDDNSSAHSNNNNNLQTFPFNAYIINKYYPIESNVLTRYILSPTCNNPYKQRFALFGDVLMDNCSKRSYPAYYSNIPIHDIPYQRVNILYIQRFITQDSSSLLTNIHKQHTHSHNCVNVIKNMSKHFITKHLKRKSIAVNARQIELNVLKHKEFYNVKHINKLRPRSLLMKQQNTLMHYNKRSSLIANAQLLAQLAQANGVFEALMTTLKHNCTELFVDIYNRHKLQVNINEQDTHGNTLLIMAVKNNASDIVKYILTEGVGVDTNIQNVSTLIYVMIIYV